MAQLRPRIEKIRQLGAELVAVGNGTVLHANWFVSDQQVDCPVFTDPSLRVFKEAGLKRGLRTILSPAVAASAVRAFARGHRQAGIKGDALQQGGILIVLPGGKIAWRHVSQYAGDLADPDEVMAELQAAVAEIGTKREAISS